MLIYILYFFGFLLENTTTKVCYNIEVFTAIVYTNSFQTMFHKVHLAVCILRFDLGGFSMDLRPSMR